MFKTALTSCSNHLLTSSNPQITELTALLQSFGLSTVCSPNLYRDTDAKTRAEILMDFYRDASIRHIFDVSGGDIANGILPYLDFDLIAESDKLFWGYSDLTTVLNAIYTKTGKPSVLYQVRNLISGHAQTQRERFTRTVLQEEDDLFDLEYQFLQGEQMEGIVVGGNIRCFLKLAGTPYFPNLTRKILLLESRGGRESQMLTYLSQLQQLGAFEKVAGILLGTFTQMEAEDCLPQMPELIKQFIQPGSPVVVTREIGHGTDAKAIRIGSPIYFKPNRYEH